MSDSAPMLALSRQQQEFVRNFLQHGNARRAAVEAGYSEKSAGSLAGNLKKNPKVAAAIEFERNRDKQKIEWTKQQAFEELQDIKALAKEKGQVVNVTKIIELQAKLTGFLDTKNDKTGNTLNINFGGLHKLIEAVKKGKDIEIEAEPKPAEEAQWTENTSPQEEQL